ncbi:MAG TPA: non-ribosomal peptide synthetase, partial [Longimicrobium sp.]
FHQVVDQDVQALAGLRQVLSGGDVVSVPHARRVLDAFPGVRLINGYGPTENTTFSTCRTVTAGDTTRVSIPIGTPISNSTAWVLDREMRPVPATVPGELYVGGDGIARGYLNAPALTAQRYVPDPFGPPGARLYRTGDRARWKDGSAEVRECGSAEVRGDGADSAPARNERTHALTHSRTAFLEFLGRLDGQVKIRGHRTEPGEVEAVLERHPSVATAVVAVREDVPGERRLVAYVVPARGTVADALPAALRTYARGLLPDHMVPAAVVAMETLPLTENGKVDRRALPAPRLQPTLRGAEPRTETERRLAAMWAEMLGVQRVGTDDRFFEIGGHSLLAVQMTGRLREEFGVIISLPRVLEADSVATLAAAVDAETAAMAAELEEELGLLSDDEVRALLEAEELHAAAGDGGR